MPEKREQDDDWNWHSQEPKQNSSTHDVLLRCSVVSPRRRDSFHGGAGYGDVAALAVQVDGRQ